MIVTVVGYITRKEWVWNYELSTLFRSNYLAIRIAFISFFDIEL